MTEPADQPSSPAERRDRHWLAKMLVASAALVMVLLGLCFVGPAVRVHYHGWSYRSGRGREASLAVVGDWAVRRSLSEAKVCRLLGPPTSSAHLGEASRHELAWWASPGKVQAGDMLCYIIFENGRAVSFQVVPGKW